MMQFKINDRVYIKPFKCEGILISIEDRDNYPFTVRTSKRNESGEYFTSLYNKSDVTKIIKGKKK